ncbi:MAG: AraC family transcriptional regulator [Tunicatimonas sp.]|uniref:helix-turn-helix transcriptional regulator n=1 Tax=Tunicatimonas sp. TaxID=1940096 RepID=UPI003C745F50
MLVQSPEAILLRKVLEDSMDGRQSYLSKHVITTVMQGEQSIQDDGGNTIRIQAGQSAVIRRGLYTVNDFISTDGRFEAYLLFFEDSLLSSSGLVNGLTPLPENSTVQPWGKFLTPPPVRLFWQSLLPWLREIPNLTPILQNIKIQEFFALLATNRSATLVAEITRAENRPQQNIRQFMADHYDKPLSIADYAYLTGRSESTFRREFKVKFGTTPRQWIIRQRMEKANDLLQATQHDVTQIAFRVGYENVSHFISEYKKQFGHTPKQQIKQNTLAVR